MNIEAMKERLVELTAANEALTAKAEAEKREFTTDEEKMFDGNLAEFERVTANIDRLGKQATQAAMLTAGVGRKTQADEPNNSSLSQAGSLGADDHFEPRAAGARKYLPQPKNGGFENLGHFAILARQAARPGGQVDPRLARLAGPTTYANEGSGGDGGFAVPSDFKTSIMDKVTGEASLLSRTDQITVSGNTLTIPKDNGTPWGTAGVRAYWGNEGGQKTQSSPALGDMTLKLHKIYSLVPITDELAEDAPAMDSYLRRKAGEAIDFAINYAIVQGDGNNKPQGILNSAATVVVAKETSQLADTIVANNIIKMWSRMHAPSRANAVWLVNQEIETQLYTMALPGKDNTGASVEGWGTHVFMPAGGLSGNPYATLFGRPVIPTQACNALGDKGDIILADLKSYLTALKSGSNPKVDVSIHLFFDWDVTAYRFVLRMTGQSWWHAPVTPRAGSSTLSPFVTLEERG